MTWIIGEQLAFFSGRDQNRAAGRSTIATT
jgi:hypothetical protein